ncbi:hypothetical protein H6G97_40475 [Nostoc flagelliforme FACHB-838]|uniref:Uncharacterized protein n=1 Tax=Nostoc flagelliforme FACHB-838 TaxID=2692904 RepID=A0ABR8E260_9NOSO|nr:hypothetical protein [Nostoc flagelliforme]MBD2535340.1 hypothetical protein [Nostoc flagelliforme FACHB-838]
MWTFWVDQALKSSQTVASDLLEAHKWLQRIANCLRYPHNSVHTCGSVIDITDAAKLPLTSFQVQCEMQAVIRAVYA